MKSRRVPTIVGISLFLLIVAILILPIFIESKAHFSDGWSESDNEDEIEAKEGIIANSVATIDLIYSRQITSSATSLLDREIRRADKKIIKETTQSREFELEIINGSRDSCTIPSSCPGEKPAAGAASAEPPVMDSVDADF